MGGRSIRHAATSRIADVSRFQVVCKLRHTSQGMKSIPCLRTQCYMYCTGTQYKYYSRDHATNIAQCCDRMTYVHLRS